MSGFWTDEIKVQESSSPRDIMRRAGDELSARTNVLTVDVRTTQLTDRVVLAFIVTNQVYLRQFNLFEVSHQIQMSYPVVIVPTVSDIPDFLKRERRIPGSPGLMAFGGIPSGVVGATPDKVVENKWVCSTPDEFTEKLKRLFAMDSVKSTIVSLQSPPPPQTHERQDALHDGAGDRALGDDHENLDAVEESDEG